MKKKISLLLCVLLAVFSFVGCSGKEEAMSSEQKELMKVHSEIMLNLCTDAETLIGYPQEELVQMIQSSSDFELNSFILSLNNFFSQYGIESIKIEVDDFRNIFNSWDAAVDECGEFKEFGEFVVDEDEFTVSVEAKFEERNAEVSVSFDEELNVESMDASAKYSLGEILTKAGLNTLLGMGTVFAVLIVLAFLISLMKYIPVLTDRFAKKEKQADTGSEAVVAEVVTETADATDDLELVAVITAAIAAQEGTTTDGFVVRSIRRRPSNNWM